MLRAHARLMWPVLCTLVVAGCSDSNSPTQIPASMSITPTHVVIEQLQSLQLTVKVLDVRGNEVQGQPVTFGADDPGLITVTVDGLVTSLGPSGNTFVRASSGPLTASAPITVGQTPTSLQTRNPVVVLGGSSRQLSTAVLDAIGTVITGTIVTYTSTNSALSVTAGGLLTASAQTGSFLVTASYLDLHTDIAVVVPTHPAGTLVSTQAISGIAWGIAISSKGVAYVTQPTTGGPVLVRFNLPSFAATSGPAGNVGGMPLAVAFSSNGAVAYVPALSPGTLSIVDVGLNQTVGSIGGLLGDLSAALVSANDDQVYVTSDNDLMYVIDVTTRTISRTIDLHAVSNMLVQHPTLPHILASSFNGAKVLEVDEGTQSVVRTLPVGGQPQGLAISPDGSELYVADELGRLVIWDLNTNTLKQEIVVPPGAFGLSLTPDGVQIYVTIVGNPQGTVLVYDRVSRSLVNTIITGPFPRRIAFDIAGTTAVITSAGTQVHFVKKRSVAGLKAREALADSLAVLVVVSHPGHTVGGTSLIAAL
jgi:hypothetical protein